MKTIQRGGRALVAYVDDGLGRRLVVAREDGDGTAESIVVALDRAEARDFVAVLRGLLQELPG